MLCWNCKSKTIIALSLLEWLLSKRPEIRNSGENMGKGEPWLVHDWWKCKLVADTMENSMQLPQKTKHWTTMRSNHFISGYTPKENEITISKRYVHPTFIAELLTKGETGKQPKCPLMDKWIKKMWYKYTMEYYSATDRNEILIALQHEIFATWNKLKALC